jgi:hypothetical protein
MPNQLLLPPPIYQRCLVLVPVPVWRPWLTRHPTGPLHLQALLLLLPIASCCSSCTNISIKASPTTRSPCCCCCCWDGALRGRSQRTARQLVSSCCQCRPSLLLLPLLLLLVLAVGECEVTHVLLRLLLGTPGGLPTTCSIHTAWVMSVCKMHRKE